MPANQKYSTRIHSRRQLTRSIEHLIEARKVLEEVGSRYVAALPLVTKGCKNCIALTNMLQNLIEDMRINI